MHISKVAREMKKLKIVLIGGGTGLSVLARGLKDYPIDITAIVTVADDGGSTGKIRSEMDIPAPGDIRNVIAALSDTEPTLKELFQYRFKENQVEGHSVGNLLIAAMTNIMDDFGHAVKELSKILNIKGRVIPSTNSSIRLNAEMEDGEIVYGESNIPKRQKTIKRVFIEPADVQPMEEAVAALEEADLIVLGPGSLYTSVISNLCVPGIGKAIVESAAPKVYVSNVMTQHGETDHFDVMDHIQAMHQHMNTDFIDYVICCENHQYSQDILENYLKEHAEPVTYHKEAIEAAGIEPITAQDLVHVSSKNRVRHNTTRLARMIYELALDLTSTIQFNPKNRKF